MLKWYLKQKNDYSCGPVALMNVVIWAGYKESFLDGYWNYTRAFRDCETDKNGTDDYTLDRSLRLWPREKITNEFKIRRKQK